LICVLSIAVLAGGLAIQIPPATEEQAKAAAGSRPVPTTRDPHTPGYVQAKEMPDGANPPANEDGNFILGPTHHPAPEMAERRGEMQGTVYEFTMRS